MPCNGVNIWSSMQENLSLGLRVRTTGADRRGPICAFAIRLLESIISEFASRENLIFQLVTVAEQADLNLNKTLFVASRPIYSFYYYIRLFMKTPIHSGK